MKKLSKILLNILGCTLLLTGCKENSPSGNGKLDDDIIPIEDVVVEDNNDEEQEEPIPKKTCQEIHSGSIGGSLIDFLAGAYMEPRYSYNCSFSHTRTFSGLYTVRSDDRTIAQVTHDSNSNVFTIKGITAGDAIIQAYTEDNELVLQFVVHVRNRIPMNKIAECLYKVDKFYGMYYGYSLAFLSANPLKGTLVGKDDFESTYANFTLVDGVEENIGEGAEFNTYKFKISIDPDTSSTSRSYTDLYVSTTGDQIYMYYTNGLVDIFRDHYVNISTL